MSMALEARKPPGLGFVGIDREGLVVAAARMGDMIDAAAERTAVPSIVDVERQRRLNVDGGLQRRRQASTP